MKLFYITILSLLIITSCKKESKNKDFTTKFSSENVVKENQLIEKESVDFYSELTSVESELLNATFKVNCTKNIKNKSYPSLIGLHPLSKFYIDLFNSKELARIIVGAYKKNDIDSIYYLKYSSLTGITRYNKQLNWHKLSRDSIIAKIEMINNENLKLWWYGFYDIEQKKWVHTESDFNIIGGVNPVILKKCIED